jgi:hypothetical protein
MKTDQAPNATPEAVCSTAMLGAWQPIETAPRDGTSFRVPPDAGYTHAFWQDGFWWWHSVHSGRDGDYAVGPEPKAWMPGPATTEFDDEDPRCIDGERACMDCMCRGACLKAPNVC